MAARFNYNRPRATAQRLITRFGMSAKLVRTEIIPGGGSEFDPAPEQQLTVHLPVTVVDLNSQIAPAGSRDPAPSEVHRVMIAPETNGVVPLETDRLLMNGKEYGLAEVREVAPGGLTVMWEADLAD